MVPKLIWQFGIEGCAGDSGGVEALNLAAQQQHVDIMAILTAAGVVDTGFALAMATGRGREASVKFLLQQHDGDAGGKRAYVNNTSNILGIAPLILSIDFGEYFPFLQRADTVYCIFFSNPGSKTYSTRITTHQLLLMQGFVILLLPRFTNIAP